MWRLVVQPHDAGSTASAGGGMVAKKLSLFFFLSFSLVPHVFFYARFCSENFVALKKKIFVVKGFITDTK